MDLLNSLENKKKILFQHCFDKTESIPTVTQKSFDPGGASRQSLLTQAVGKKIQLLQFNYKPSS